MNFGAWDCPREGIESPAIVIVGAGAKVRVGMGGGGARNGIGRISGMEKRGRVTGVSGTGG